MVAQHSHVFYHHYHDHHHRAAMTTTAATLRLNWKAKSREDRQWGWHLLVLLADAGVHVDVVVAPLGVAERNEDVEEAAASDVPAGK